MAEAESTRFLYYLSVYVILSKNSFSWCLTPGFDFSSRNPAALGIAQVNLALPSLARFLSESGCKGTTFQDSLQTFRQLFFGGGEYFRDYLQNASVSCHDGLHFTDYVCCFSQKASGFEKGRVVLEKRRVVFRKRWHLLRKGRHLKP